MIFFTHQLCILTRISASCSKIYCVTVRYQTGSSQLQNSQNKLFYFFCSPQGHSLFCWHLVWIFFLMFILFRCSKICPHSEYGKDLSGPGPPLWSLCWKAMLMKGSRSVAYAECRSDLEANWRSMQCRCNHFVMLWKQHVHLKNQCKKPWGLSQFVLAMNEPTLACLWVNVCTYAFFANALCMAMSVYNYMHTCVPLVFA